jgi:acetyl-CoA C-acetyltransferase
MLEGPIPVTNKALRNAKMNASDIDLLRLMKLCSGSMRLMDHFIRSSSQMSMEER